MCRVGDAEQHRCRSPGRLQRDLSQPHFLPSPPNVAVNEPDQALCKVLLTAQQFHSAGSPCHAPVVSDALCSLHSALCILHSTHRHHLLFERLGPVDGLLPVSPSLIPRLTSACTVSAMGVGRLAVPCPILHSHLSVSVLSLCSVRVLSVFCLCYRSRHLQRSQPVALGLYLAVDTTTDAKRQRERTKGGEVR